MKSRQLIIIVTAILILAAGYFLMGLFSGMKEAPPETEPEQIRRAVKARSVSYSDVSVTFEASGRLGSHQYVDIIAEVQGEILPGFKPLKKGQTFRKGELLVRIFDDEAEYNLKASRAKFLTSIANALPDVRIDYPDRYDALLQFFESIDINRELPELPEIKSLKIKTFLSSRGILNEYYSIKSLEIRFEKYQIFAPFDGVITQVFLEAGSIANQGTRIATFIRTDRLELEVPVEVNDASWVRIGDEVDVLSEDRSTGWTGRVIRKADFVDPTSQAVSVFISVYPTTDKPIYEGQYLRAVFRGRVVENAMEIPRNAVFNSNEIFIVNDGALKKRVVKVHKVNQESLIFSGLEEGSVIVTEPLANAREGTLVDIIGN